MAKFEDHCRDCERILGNRYEDVNHWMDALFRQYGPAHRKHRHCWYGVGEAKRLFGAEGAKAAIVHMTKVTAAQLAGDKIRVNCICPGLIATNIFAAGLGMPSQLAETRLDAIAEAANHSQPLQRGGRPRDIAEAALYLASDGSDWVTGHALVVDGGLTLGPQGMQQMAAFAPIIQALGLDADALAAIAAARG